MKTDGISTNTLILLLSVLGIIFACEPAKKTNLETSLRDQINELITEYHNNGSFDGTILVADSGHVIFKGAFGYSNKEKGSTLTTNSQFYLASVSKQFTACSILLMIQQGLIDPLDLIYPYLPELPDIYKEISFQNLLQHTSGIPDYYDFASLSDGFTNADVLNVLSQVESLEFEPGHQYKYSNSGYVLLSILVERVTGIRFANYLYQNAFQPYELKNTVVYDQYAKEPEWRVTGYGEDGSLTDYRFRTTGGGGIFSNVEDLYKWHNTLSAYNLIKKKIMDLAYQPTKLKNDSTIYYGFGWFIDPDDPKHVYHTGTLEGFRTFYDRQLDNENVIIILSNNSSAYLNEMVEKIRTLIESSSE